MIVTLTPNPSIDRTVVLPGALERGEVQRCTDTFDHPGGKGVNVAGVVHHGGERALAVLPGDDADPFVALLRGTGLPHRSVPVGGSVRVNLTVSEPSGVTTKINAAGPVLDEALRETLAVEVETSARDARWVVLCGSLPPGAPDDWYAQLVARLARPGLEVAVDTSGAALVATLGTDGPLPSLVKPNGEELASVAGGDAEEIEADPRAGVAAARRLLDRGVGRVLLTQGGHGAVLVTPEGAWRAPVPRITPRSTVGAGDSALAGYLLGDLRGLPEPERLALAVAYGSAAASLPGSQTPTPRDLPEPTVAEAVESP
ncbi:MAG: 1-phosphofructokinase family hexose kinase [Nocardioidaceae bacterium]|nr:1-phosphofructokinase family hexose kinase [Nocardioidaceae bacterium]